MRIIGFLLYICSDSFQTLYHILHAKYKFILTDKIIKMSKASSHFINNGRDDKTNRRYMTCKYCFKKLVNSLLINKLRTRLSPVLAEELLFLKLH